MDTFARLPLVDLGRLAAHSAERRRLALACRDWGMFELIGHGIPAPLSALLQTRIREFFAEPQAAKRLIERTRDNPWGYFDRELTKNRRDWKEIYDVGPPGTGALAASRPQWPGGLPAFRTAVEAYIQACERVAVTLLGEIARTLGAAPEVFTRHFGASHTSFLRLNHYPRCGDPAAAHDAALHPQGQLGIHAHTDAGALTLLLQDGQPGLQTYHEGRWRLVPARRGAMVVNLGDIVQVWSNDHYRAPPHRVLTNRDRARYTAAYFLNPVATCTYAPLPTMVSASTPPRYRPIHWGEFRRARADGDYADLGEEIQISHFAIGRPAPIQVRRRPVRPRGDSHEKVCD